ncbi:hypothetical protein VitviT2T_007039 [Vitis vinifera]|uniref:Heat stress transcription factor A-5 n=1 Tax=Vitis vinifera TaxID=29760 RepID=A0ABY9BXK6_VITVI|nr:hypothetical protein VitviT2T_007039 [Vitis vinifera]
MEEGIPMETLASVLGCKIGSLPTSYLGLPLGASYKSPRVWDAVEERFRKRLSLWKRQYLSKGGHLTLLKSTLSSLPTYFLSRFVIPKRVCARLEKIQKDFLWGGGALENKPHLGFRKSDPERWEFANEDFVKDQKHLLKNIHRRKPIHSHSHPQGPPADSERAAFDEEIERLSREKTELQLKVYKVKEQQSAKLQLEDLTQRVSGMEQRQEKLLTFLEKAVQNPTFVKHLAQKIESMDFSAYNKKRRLPQVDHLQPVAENSLLDNYSSSRTECGSIFHKDFSNKLKLELSPAASDINLLSQSTQSSNEDAGSPHMKISEGDPKEMPMRTEGHLFAPETLELSDTGTSFTFKRDPTLSQQMGVNESQRLLYLQESLTSTEEGDGHISCHLNLTLASSPLQVDKSSSTRMPQIGQDIGKSSASRSIADAKEADFRAIHKSRNFADDDTILSSSQGASVANEAPPTAPVRVNDVFWEQFLTERPGSSDTEEASSNFRSNPYDEQEDRRAGQGMLGNSKSMEHLTL